MTISNFSLRFFAVTTLGVAASSTLALVIGAIIATVVSFGIAFTVIRLTDMLRR